MTVTIQVGVVTEVCVVRMVRGSMAVDREVDRLKVSRCLAAGHQSEEQQQYRVHFCYPIGADLCF